MTTRKNDSQAKNRKSGADQIRDLRRAEALRENLKRRKQQSRDRAADPEPRK